MDKQWEKLVQEASEILETKEHYQKRLGEIASTILSTYGYDALQGFAGEIADTAGIRISPSTLYNYQWTYKKIEELKLPSDIPFSICQMIAGTANPQEWADKINKEGYSGGHVAKMIKEGRPKKLKACPNCHHPVTETVCPYCKKNIEV